MTSQPSPQPNLLGLDPPPPYHSSTSTLGRSTGDYTETRPAYLQCEKDAKCRLLVGQTNMFRRTTNASKQVAGLRCSFCSKTQDAVRELIAGPSVLICDECVEACADIIAESRGKQDPPDSKVSVEASGPTDSVPSVCCALCRTPTPSADALLVEARGALCPGCVGEVEAAIIRMRESTQ